jgi:hypothetical protein
LGEAAGSNRSTVSSGPLVFTPTTIRTSPEGSSVAVWPVRASLRPSRNADETSTTGSQASADARIPPVTRAAAMSTRPSVSIVEV